MNQKEQEQHVAKHSLPTSEQTNNTNLEQFPLAKLPKKKNLPLRGPRGWFISKALLDTDNSSSTFTSSASSPIDTPEINEWQLSTDEEESEQWDTTGQEVSEHLKEDDEDSLPDTPEPFAILLPAFHWDAGIPPSVQTREDNLPFPAVQPPSPPHESTVLSVIMPLKIRTRPTTVFKQTQNTKIPMLMPSSNAPLVFHGCDSENSASFIRTLEGYILIHHVTDEALKTLLLGTFIAAGSEADGWWTSLDPVEKSTWAKAKAAFLTKWPAMVAAKKTQREYQKELLELRLKEDKVGEHVAVAGIATWVHLLFHNKLQTLVKDTGVESVPILIQPVCEALP
jgi:hypothetical protein